MMKITKHKYTLYVDKDKDEKDMEQKQKKLLFISPTAIATANDVYLI